MEPMMERVQPVITPRANLSDRRLDSPRCMRLHSATSIPSYPTSQPARSTRRRSDESSLRTGFVLLMWMKMRRACHIPSAPRPSRRRLIATWPMRHAVFSARSPIISSWSNSVPSNRIASARRMRSRIAGVTPAAPGI